MPVVCVVGFVTGCAKPAVIVDQESPLLIIGASGSATVAAWDPDLHELRVIGTIDTKELEGLTAVAFDWSVYEQDEDDGVEDTVESEGLLEEETEGESD